MKVQNELIFLTFIGVLNALCCSSKDSPGYIDVLGQVGLRDPHSAPTIHSSLAVFTAILIARHCFTLPDFLKNVVLPSLMEAWNSGKTLHSFSVPMHCMRVLLPIPRPYIQLSQILLK